MIKLIIDGKDYSADADLDTVSTVIGLNTSTESFNLETGGVSINVRDDAAKYLKEIYIDNCHYPPKVLPAKLITDYGDFELSILPHNFTWCDDCTGDVLLSSGLNEEICFNRLNNTPLLSEALWTYLIAQNKFRKIMVSKDISTFNAIGIGVFGFVHMLGTIFATGQTRARAGFALWGTGRWVPAIKVTDIFDFYANQCGKIFKSTILQNAPYNRMYLIPAINEKGNYFYDWNLTLDGTDRFTADLTVVEFLNVLNDLFYAEWRISTNNIELTPADRIRQDAVNVGTLQALEKICLTPINHNCAKQSYEYALDYVDQVGDSERDVYNYTEDYQINNRALSEPCRLPIPLSIAANPKGKSENEFVTGARAPGNNDLIDLWEFLHKELLLSNHRSALPKLIINSIEAENASTRFGNFVIMDQIDFKGHKLTNPQTSFNPEVPGNLYTKYQYKRNPANGYYHCQELKSVDNCFSEELLNNLRAAFAEGKTVYMTSEHGNMYFTSAEVFFGVGQRIQLNDIKVYPNE